MGMPITVEIVDRSVSQAAIDAIFDYFTYIDDTFSTFKGTSEITAINEGHLKLSEASADMQTVFALAEQTKAATLGYFDIERNGRVDPSGLVKGWAIENAAELLWRSGFENFYVEAGGDIQVSGRNGEGDQWRVGIRNPFNIQQIVKVLSVTDCGIATSGNTIRGAHIYNPHQSGAFEPEIVSLTVIGPNIYEADRFATAAFAMDRRGIGFIENLPGFDGYMIDQDGIATLTSGFGAFCTHA
jgi:thiamine biosynthesis lipoprotein